MSGKETPAAARSAPGRRDAEDAATPPRMSVILVTPDRFERLERTVAALRAQTALEELEVVVVVPSRAGAGIDEDALSAFRSRRVVETGPTGSSAVRRAAGVLAATAPIVAFTEDHSFPGPDWARSLIAAHAGPWAAVGPAFENGNPGSLTSWTNLLIEYGPWVGPVEGGPRDHIPPHNGSYKRALLLGYGERLAEMIEAETVLQWDLGGRGHGLYLESAARTRHFNVSRMSSTIPLRIAVGRMFGAARAREWPLWRRLAYAGASPLIPLVRFARMIPVVRRCGAAGRLFPRVLPLLLAGFVLDGFGEFLGYAFGGGGAVTRVTEFEYDRPRHMSPADRSAFLAS